MDCTPCQVLSCPYASIVFPQPTDGITDDQVSPCHGLQRSTCGTCGRPHLRFLISLGPPHTYWSWILLVFGDLWDLLKVITSFVEHVTCLFFFLFLSMPPFGFAGLWANRVCLSSWLSLKLLRLQEASTWKEPRPPWAPSTHPNLTWILGRTKNSSILWQDGN